MLIADDHELIRFGLVAELRAVDPEARLLEASDHAQVHALLAIHGDIGLILLDLYMPGGDGFELVSQICNQFPEVPVIVVSGSERLTDMRKVIDRGASGYVPKSKTRSVIGAAIRLVLAGGIYIPECLLHPCPAASEELPDPTLLPMPDSVDGAPFAGFTYRQVEVLKLLCKGHSNKSIARELAISTHTVKVHIASVLKLLQVENRTAAAVAARRLGLCGDRGPSSSG
ncbi:MAG: response regulator [Thiotrichales bacterium]